MIYLFIYNNYIDKCPIIHNGLNYNGKRLQLIIKQVWYTMRNTKHNYEYKLKTIK